MSAPSRKRLAVTAAIAAGVVFGMIGMAYAAVPLYELFCRVTGYGGTTQTAQAAPSVILDRTMQVRFDSNVDRALPIEFAPSQRTQTLRIGETSVAFYRVRNTSDQPVTAMATFNVTPHAAGQYFAKLECFCFTDRTLQPGEEADLPVLYFIDPELVSDIETRDIRTVTLSYTFFRSSSSASSGTPS